jgi:hypothetical protein
MSKSLKNRIKTKGKEYSEHDYKRALSPFLEMAKDVVETGSHYKNWKQVRRDLAQPLIGVGNVLKGTGILCLSILGIIFYPIGMLAINFISDYGSIKNKEHYFNYCVSSALYGMTSALKGAIQIVTAPLTWFIKMPVRAIITAYKIDQPIIEYRKIKDAHAGNTSKHKPIKDSWDVSKKAAKYIKLAETNQKEASEYFKKFSAKKKLTLAKEIDRQNAKKKNNNTPNKAM